MTAREGDLRGGRRYLTQSLEDTAGDLRAVSDAVRAFFTNEFQAREIRITRITAATGPDPGWEAEVEILVPDLAVKTLGLPLSQEVLERCGYVVQLDQSLAVRGYETLGQYG